MLNHIPYPIAISLNNQGQTYLNISKVQHIFLMLEHSFREIGNVDDRSMAHYFTAFSGGTTGTAAISRVYITTPY